MGKNFVAQFQKIGTKSAKFGPTRQAVSAVDDFQWHNEHVGREQCCQFQVGNDKILIHSGNCNFKLLPNDHKCKLQIMFQT